MTYYRIIIVLLFLLPGYAMAYDTTPWGAHRIIIADYTVHRWSPIVTETVDEFNDVMPGGGPSLTYEQRPSTLCADLPPNPARGEVWVCASDSVANCGVTVPLRHKGSIRGAAIGIPDACLEAGKGVVCHEMMHALTGIPDNYGALPDTSCVWGDLTSPGSWDIALLRDVYSGRHRHGS